MTWFVYSLTCHCGNLGKKHYISEENSSIWLWKQIRSLADASVTLRKQVLDGCPVWKMLSWGDVCAWWPGAAAAYALWVWHPDGTLTNKMVFQVVSWKCSYTVLHVLTFSFKHSCGLATFRTVLRIEVHKPDLVLSCASLPTWNVTFVGFVPPRSCKPSHLCFSDAK